MRLIALKDISLVADDTGIVGQILMMLYIAGYKPRFVERWVVSLSYHLQESTWFSNAQPQPQNLLSCCLLLALISLPLNDPIPRRQNIGIFFRSQMCCLQDNSRSEHLYHIIDLNMEHIDLHAYSSRKVEHWLKKK